MHWLPAILILPYFFLLLRFFRGLLKTKTFKVSTDPATFVSVIIACRNEKEHLPVLLQCIAGQDYPSELFEVIIVNDNSTDNTFEIASTFNGPVNIIAVNNTGMGKKQSIATGINASTGKLIITTDADCRMEKSWIRTIAAFYEEYAPDMIVCPVQIESKPGFFSRFQELEFLSLQGITAGSLLTGNATMCNGANLSFTRKAYYEHIGNLHFEIKSGDDIFLLHSLKKEIHSKIMWLESLDSMITTIQSPDVDSFFRQRARWISKSKVYEDRFTKITGTVTFIAILIQIIYLAAGIINQIFILVFIAIFLMKSLPDYLILKNTTGRYRKRQLMHWFIPAQIIYPFYVLGVLLIPIISPDRKDN